MVNALPEWPHCFVCTLPLMPFEADKQLVLQISLIFCFAETDLDSYCNELLKYIPLIIANQALNFALSHDGVHSKY